MKKLITTSLALGLLAGCASTGAPLNTDSPDTLSASDRKKALEDTRGHKPGPMDKWRLHKLLEEYNANGDEQISWGEYNDWRRARFDKTDTNGNGTVDTEEYVYEFEGRLDERLEKGRKAHVEQTERRFKALDKNESGTIEWDEYAASGDRIFSRWDSNGDGVIDETDPQPVYKKGKDAKHHQHREAGRNDGDNSVDKASHKKKYAKRKGKTNISFIDMPTTHNRKGLMEIYDANGDGAVTSDEFIHERRSVFHLGDQDKNGKLTQDEYLAEFEDRLDSKIAASRRGSIKQTYVRFKALDDNDDGKMTFDEFQISGKRIFTRWDKNGDSVVSSADIEK